MTYIKKMKIHGFKSFAKPIELPFSKDFSAVIGPNGSGKCVSGNTIVQLSDGSLTKIQELVNQRLKANSYVADDGYLAEGDGKRILSLNLNTLKIEEKPILAYVKRRSPKTLLSIRTRSGKTIIATKYHPLFILDNMEVRSIKAEELKEGTKIAIPNKIRCDGANPYFEELLDEIRPEDNLYIPWKQEYKDILRKCKKTTWNKLPEVIGVPKTILKGIMDKQNINLAFLIRILRYARFKNMEIMNNVEYIKSKNSSKLYKIPWKNSEEFSRLFGYLLAEGRLPNYTDHVWFTNGDEEIVEDYINLIWKVFEAKPTINEYKPRCYDVITYSQPIRILLNKFGMPLGGTTDKKTINNIYLRHSTEHQLAGLLNGLYCGDGYISNRSIEITTKSKALGFCIESILARLGIDYRSVFQVKAATNTGFSGMYKTIRIYGVDNFLKFKERINLVHKEKQKRLDELTKDKNANPNVDLIELNAVVKDIVKELKIKIKPNRGIFPRLESYYYNQCTPSRHGLSVLYKELFTPLVGNQIESLALLKKHIDSNIFWDEIVEINEIESDEEWVYDLCIEENHNFIANNIIVHNSNVVDSLCFVLGRLSSKSMRADNSAKLIYNGGKHGNPAKEAYVSILFDNSQNTFPAKAKEIEIKRLVRHNGQSKYFINGELRTRQQVLDLLAAAKINPDGHNIILQGDITHAAEMPSEERREIVEDIAGISIYEDKKEKAVRELDKVESQLKEASIILTERGTYLKELKKDYDQASKYKELEKNVKSNKATYLSLQVKQREEKLEKVVSLINKNQSQIDSINSKVKQVQQDREEKRQDIQKLKDEIEKSGESSQLALHSEIETLKEQLSEDKIRFTTIQNEIKSLNERTSQLKSSLHDSDKRVNAMQEKKSKLQDELESIKDGFSKNYNELSKLKEKHSFDDMEAEIAKLDSEIESIKSQNFEEKKLALLRDKDKVELRLSTIEKLASKPQLAKLNNLKQNLKQSAQNLNRVMEEDSALLNQLSSARIRLQQIKEEHIRLKTQQTLAKEHSINLAINKIKSLNMQGVFGTFAELAQVPPEYSLAIEVAAGSRINSIVVKDDGIAAKCIQYLKSNKLGTAIFLPLNKLKVQSPGNIKEGHGLAINLIKFDSKFEQAFKYVLGNTIIVDNIDAARKIGIGKYRMATLDGDLVETSGAMIGGFRRKHSSLFLTPGIEKNLDSLSSEISKFTSLIKDIEKKLSINGDKVGKAREEKSTFEGEMLKIQASIGDIDNILNEKQELEKNLRQLTSQISAIDSTINKNSSSLNELNRKRAQIREKIGNKRNPKIMAQIESLEKLINGLNEKKILINSEINNISSQVKELILPEKESMQKIIKQNLSQLESFNSEVKTLSSEISGAESAIKAKEKEEAKLYSNFKGMLSKREKLNQIMQELEIKINNEKNKTQIFEERINNFSIDKAKIVSEIAGLNQEMLEYKDVKLRRGLSESELKDEITKFESMMRNLGNVNLRALEIYEQVGKEYESLEQKSSKLKVEKEDVLKMIEEVESRKTSTFMKSFNKINSNFESIFSQLTTKGTAHLVLENPEKPLEGGVQVMVKIAHNKFLDIKSLSGGEKTLTALAFIFSIQDHDPAPFYLLDEVDAALDKKNSEKLSELIKKYSQKAQYIVITHNDSVIGGADKLYGVSMHQDGISHVVSLKV